jgi:hypothetical protein
VLLARHSVPVDLVVREFLALVVVLLRTVLLVAVLGGAADPVERAPVDRDGVGPGVRFGSRVRFGSGVRFGSRRSDDVAGGPVPRRHLLRVSNGVPPIHRERNAGPFPYGPALLG